MQLHYFETKSGNFGDDMNLWFWDVVLPKWREYDQSYALSGIGTLINNANFSRLSKILICGSGCGYGGVKPFAPEHVTVSWVRGPQTADILGLEPEAAVTDPACVISDFHSFSAGKQKKGTVFVPHCSTASLDLNWKRLSKRLGMEIVLPQRPAEEVIEALRDAEMVIAESLHAAIIADTFRTPWIPVSISPDFNNFKWRDWAKSMELDFEIHPVLQVQKDAFFSLRKIKNSFGTFARGRKKQEGSVARRNDVIQAELAIQNDMKKAERSRVKSAISRLSPVIEIMLARELKALSFCSPVLSSDSVLSIRKSEIYSRISKIEQGFGA
ncbi:MAG: polysaccharide pyruvyl transferase family protein [Pseudomonadota bacterium]